MSNGNFEKTLDDVEGYLPRKLIRRTKFKKEREYEARNGSRPSQKGRPAQRRGRKKEKEVTE